MTVTFMGLTGPSGALPTHYTQMLMDLGRDVRGPERRSLRDWFDLFNHRAISLFYRAWEKYRFPLAFERGESDRRDPDPFTRALLSVAGIGASNLRNRLCILPPDSRALEAQASPAPLAQIDDLALLFYTGILAQRPRNATNLKILLSDYFKLAIEVQQFRGQWLQIEPPNQTCLGVSGLLGMTTVAGSRVWDVQTRFRLRVGPLDYHAFEECLPDPDPVRLRKTFFLIVQLTRLFAGMELDFDIQLVLQAKDVPEIRLEQGLGMGPRLGWNTWLISEKPQADVHDAVFEAGF